MARRMPAPANPHMANQLRPLHPQYRPSTQLPQIVQHPSGPRPTHLQNPQPSSGFPSQPFHHKSFSNPQLPRQYSPPQSKQPSLQQHSPTNPLPLHNYLQPGSQNGKSSQSLEQSPQPAQTDSQARQHLAQKDMDYEETKESDMGSEINDLKGTSESENPGNTPALNWNEFPQHENRWMGNRRNINSNSDTNTGECESSDEITDESL